MNETIELDRLLPGYVLITPQRAEQLAADGVQVYVYRRQKWGDMWFVKEKSS